MKPCLKRIVGDAKFIKRIPVDAKIRTIQIVCPECGLPKPIPPEGLKDTDRAFREYIGLVNLGFLTYLRVAHIEQIAEDKYLQRMRSVPIFIGECSLCYLKFWTIGRLVREAHILFRELLPFELRDCRERQQRFDHWRAKRRYHQTYGVLAESTPAAATATF